VEQTVQWYRKAGQFTKTKEFQKLTRRQIAQYIDQARATHLPWVQPVISP